MFDPGKIAAKDFAVLGLGEVLLRLSPPNKERILAGEVFEKRAGGSELNVVSGISLLGLRTGIITKLPENEIGKYIRNKIRFTGVSDDYIIPDRSKEARLGIYYYESGAAPRKPTVVYDRNHSSFNSISPAEIPPEVYAKTAVFHTSGITMALNEGVRKAAGEMIARFKAGGALISFDVNFRASLWSESEARAVIAGLLPAVDLLFISEETLRKMFQREGRIEEVVAGFSAEFGCRLIAASQRQVLSPTKHAWNSLLYVRDEGRFYRETPYQEIEVIDRIGSGDAYLAGVLFGLLKYGDYQAALEYGNAMAAVKNTIPGDMPASDWREITKVIEDHKRGGGSELNR
ncbi:MAG: sugar kinase [Bacteroidota bacterium]